MKKIFLFVSIICFVVRAAVAQSKDEKQKTKIERPGFKEKIKGTSAHMIMMSSASHPAYVRHSTTTHHHVMKHVRNSTARRHVAMHHKAVHYKKIKRVTKNGEYKVKYKK